MPSCSSSPVVEFYYDIVCPFAYIASTRIEAVTARAAATVVWRPVLLGGIYRATEAPQGAEGSATDPMNPTKKAVFGRAFRRTLKRFQVPIDPPKEHPRKTVDALRLLHYLPASVRAAVSQALFAAYWVDHVDVTNRDVLLEVARRALRDAPDVRARLTAEVFSDENAKRCLEQATADAVQRGAPGVPGFWIPEEAWRDTCGKTMTGRLYWGQDRMHFVEASLLRLGSGLPSASDGIRLRELIPRCRDLEVLNKSVKLEFWFDFSSPWAYLGWTRLKGLQKVFGSQLQVELKPILLGALFKDIGAPQMPSMVISEQKRRYNLLDLLDWVKFWSTVDQQEGYSERAIGFRWPDTFPIRSPSLLRCAIANPDCVPVLYEACWALNRNVSDEGALKQVLAEAGYDGEQLLAKARLPATKEALFANTQAAKEAGFCGVPTYRVFHRGPKDTWAQMGSFVWGQDELAVVEDLIAGWDEALGELATSRENGTWGSRLRL
ncbi:protein disulfide [Xylariaceae sp. FL1651]|nr:protein disulfide [Xylariaceae sp. FL1651]